MEQETTYTAFVGEMQIASGAMETMLSGIKARFDQDQGTPFLIFEDQTGRQVDYDLRGSLDDVLARVLPERSRLGPGRPRLGVVSREISLLPRHWDWLEQQPNGASAALRRLVDQARKREPRSRLATMALGRLLSAMAGNLPGCEEASRALYAGKRAVFSALIRDWPGDIRAYIERRAEEAFGTGGEETDS